MARLERVLRDADSDSGAAAVIVAVTLVVLLGVAALTVDAGAIYAERRQMQTAADAAALAGVTSLPSDPGQAIEIASSYALLNTSHAGDTTFEVQSTYAPDDTLMAWLEDPAMGLFFARILGKDTTPVNATATATIVSPSGFAKNVMPFGVLNGAFPYGETRDLKFYAQDPEAENALSQLMYLTDPPGGAGGTSLIVSQIKYEDRDVPVHIGESYETGPQVNGTPINNAVNTYIGTNQDTLADIATVVEQDPGEPPVIQITNYDSPRLWICPVLGITSWAGVSPGDAIPIVSFVYLYIPPVVPDCPDAQAIGSVGQPNPSLGTGNNANAWLYMQVVRPTSPEEVAEWGAFNPNGAFAYRLVD